MSKYLLALTIAISLSACGGSGGEPQVVNTAAIIAGTDTGRGDGAEVISGSLTIVDPDVGEELFVVQVNVSSNYGIFSLTADGLWRYEVNRSSTGVIELTSEESVVEQITVRSADGTSHTISVTVLGLDNDPVFGSGDGVDSVTMNSDGVSVSGVLTISDPDTDQSVFMVQTGVSVDYGNFTISANGQWTYTLDANNSDVLALTSAADSLIATISVTSFDGTSSNIVITIIGVGAVMSGLIKGEIGDNDTVPTISCTTTVNSIAALISGASYDMTPGETLCLAAGEYSGLDLAFGGTGSSEAPITIAAAQPGSVAIGGEVNVQMSGEYVTLQGFIFKDGSMDFSVISTRGNGNQPCHYCRITEVSIIDMDEGMSDSTQWVKIYGTHNRIDHSWFSGKTTRGALLIIDRSVGDEGFDPATFEIDYAQIDHNYFGDRPPKDGSAYAESRDNEYEGIRIGTSDSHTGDSFTVVEHNYFERIQGEAEVISNKSGNNIIRHNTIRDSHGSIVTRHGAAAIISNNFIMGDDHPFSGGIRIVDGEHRVTNNYIQGVRYLKTNFNGGIVLSSSEGETVSGYQDVENVLISNNTIVDSVNSLNVFGGRENTKPDSVYFVNNVIADAIGPVIKNAGDMPTNSTFAGNVVFGQAFSDDDGVTSLEGMAFMDAALVVDNQGLYRPSDSSPDLQADTDAFVGSYTLPLTDMDGQARSESTLAGADEVLATAVTRGLLFANLVGPLNYTPPSTEGHVVKLDIANHDFDSGDFTGWINNGASITTALDEVFSRGSSLKLDSVDANVSQTITLTPNTNYTLSAFIKGVGKLTVTVDGNIYDVDQKSSDYAFTSVSFNSGGGTSAVITASMDNLVVNSASIINPDFDSKQGNWTVQEGTGIGQVQDSSNSSDNTDGSIKFKYNLGADSGTPYDPYIAQTVNVKPDTEYTLSMYNLLKSSHTGSSVIFGVFAEDSSTLLSAATLLASKESIYSDLVAADAPEGEDSFLQDNLTINTGSSTSLSIFAQYKTSTGDEIRVDEFDLTYFGAPENGTEVYFDSFRLVSHAE